MDSWKKHWKALLFFGAFLWGVFYAVAWFRRANCESLNALACATQAALRFGANVIMLEWVDTTLGAGALAVMAGAFVLIAANNSRKDAVADRERRDAEILHRSIWNLRQMWSLASLKIHRGDPVAATIAPLTSIIEISDILPHSAFELGVKLSALARIALTIAERGEDGADQELEKIFFVVRNFLDEPERLIEEGQYRHSPALLDESQMEEAASLGLLSDDRPVWVDDMLAPGTD